MAQDGHADSTYTQRGRERVTMRCHSVGGGYDKKGRRGRKPVPKPPHRGRTRSKHAPVRREAAPRLLAWGDAGSPCADDSRSEGPDRLPGGADGDKGDSRGTHITSSRAALESFPPSERTSQV